MNILNIQSSTEKEEYFEIPAVPFRMMNILKIQKIRSEYQTEFHLKSIMKLQK